MPFRLPPKARWPLLGAFVLLPVGVLGGSAWFGLAPPRFLEQGARVAATPALALAYREDLDFVEARVRSYLRGAEAVPADAGGEPAAAVAARGPTGAEPWSRFRDAVPGHRLVAESRGEWDRRLVPFVYEHPDAPHLRAVRERYDLPGVVAGAIGEYEAQLKLANWAGTRFHHGTDPAAGGEKACDVVGLVEAGMAGERYWCVTAARTFIHAAQSLGWPARLLSLSTNGYDWQHAVAEVWSAEWRKWYVVDADFNFVYEREGVPLSAVELMAHGLDWERSGELRVRPIAPEKLGINRGGHTLALYRYQHVDLRNDWCTRPLRRGSPAGGDLNTRFATAPDFGPVLTAIPRVEQPADLQWGVDAVTLVPRSVQAQPAAADGVLATASVVLGAYSPAFRGFEVRIGSKPWRPLDGDRFEVPLRAGATTIEARVRSAAPFPGPAARVVLTLAPG